jgi:hypothetical protein
LDKRIMPKTSPKMLVISDDIEEVVLHTTKPRLIRFKCINLETVDHLCDRHMKITNKHKVTLV